MCLHQVFNEHKLIFFLLPRGVQEVDTSESGDSLAGDAYTVATNTSSKTANDSNNSNSNSNANSSNSNSNNGEDNTTNTNTPGPDSSAEAEFENLHRHLDGMLVQHVVAFTFATKHL